MTAPAKDKSAEEETKGLGLSPTQVISGAGASVTSTVAGSTLGASGTLWGAAIGSVISTIAAALYAHSLKRGKARITKVLPVNAPPGATAVPGRDDTKVLPAHLDPKAKPKRFDIKLDRKFWIKVAVFAVGMFLAVMAVITGLELLTQEPVSALVGNTETSRSTTLGTVTDDTPSTPVAPEDEQQEESPVTTSTPDRDDEGTEPTSTSETEVTEQEGGTETTRTAESTSERTAERTAERTTEDTTEAPTRTTAQPEPTSGADAEE
jgi:hypothetical protein